MKPLVYILQSRKIVDIILAVLIMRIKQHNNGLAVSTKNIRPLELKAINGIQ